MTKRDLMVASTRHHHARFLKYYPRRHCAPSLIKSRFFPHTTNLLTVLTFLHFEIPYMYIHAGNPRMPPRVLASGPKPCGGNKQNNTWALGDMEFIFSCSNSISHSFAALIHSISMWTLEDTVNCISPRAICYSVCNP